MHGATATMAVTHIAIVEQLNGKSADWMEQVSDEQYLARMSNKAVPTSSKVTVQGVRYPESLEKRTCH
jgi:hypothetical protein